MKEKSGVDFKSILKKAAETDDYSELQRFSTHKLECAKKKWEPFRKQDEDWSKWNAIDSCNTIGWNIVKRFYWFINLFMRPKCTGGRGRFQAVENLVIAKSLSSACSKKDYEKLHSLIGFID